MSHANTALPAEGAIEKLKAGNEAYVASGAYAGDVSAAIRQKTAEEGQLPYATVITCSDSRVIPEAIFSAGIGDLFVIRVAGNVIDRNQLGSVEYAADHLGTRLVVVLGHTGCGAVDAAMHSEPTGYIAALTDEIKSAIGDETDAARATARNAVHSAQKIRRCLNIQPGDTLKVIPAVYDIATGKVEFMPEG